MAERKKPSRSRRRKAEPRSRGLEPADVASDDVPARVRELERTIEGDGGRALGRYRDPLGGHWQVLAALPLERVAPTAFQRDLSEAHSKRLAAAIERLGRFLDPVIAVRAADGRYLVPNGGHRTEALKQLGARSIVALVVPDAAVAFQILALNTEKAHNLREKALEAVRMARELARIDDRAEREFAAIFEEPALLTLGLCYEENGRFSGGVYNSMLKRVESFLDAKLSKAIGQREGRRQRLFELDREVVARVAELKTRGFESPYLKNYVVSRINPLAFRPGASAEFDETLDKMLASAKKFDAARVRADQVARSGGAPAEE
jgi:ParB family chromosome partitioning protein